MQGRLIPLDSFSGNWNMSVDQALLESVDATQVPMLRFYQWSAPTLSLGYFQQLSARDQHTASHQVDCVRRSTGGGAILHHHELTYSIAFPLASSHLGARHDLYQGMHDVIRDALSNWSIRAAPYREDPRRAGRENALLCFQRRTDEDLIVSGYKVLGSAQRRAKNAILQHGSLLLQCSPFAPELPGMIDLGASKFTVGELAACIAQGSSKKWPITFEEDSVSESEKTLASSIETNRFGSPAWLNRR